MASYQLKLKERRIAERKRLTGLLPGRFQINGKDVAVKPVDISSHGLGVIIEAEFSAGTKASLMVGERSIPLEVKWGEPDFGKHDMWRYGLVCTDQSVNLEDEFMAHGCLK
jgi:hypothetical protein